MLFATDLMTVETSKIWESIRDVKYKIINIKALKIYCKQKIDEKNWESLIYLIKSIFEMYRLNSRYTEIPCPVAGYCLAFKQGEISLEEIKMDVNTLLERIEKLNLFDASLQEKLILDIYRGK
jgi:hypothetical protein